MTDTTSKDDELHSILAPITGDNTKAGDVRKAVEAIKQYGIQERIDELNSLYRTDAGMNNPIVTERTIENRKAELTALKLKQENK